jgi:glycosyltransferase involved in cell wall biosynthesis
MNIAVNVRFLLKNKLEGIGVFSMETLRRITRNHPEHRFIFIFDRPYHPEFLFSDNVEARVLHPPARHPLLWIIWFSFQIPRLLKKINPDVFVSMDGFLAPASKIQQLSVIHDIAFEHYPKDIPWTARKYYQYYFPKFARHATRIATVSEFSKTDISQSYQIDPSKIDVVYNAASDHIHPITETEKTEVRNKISNGKPYFIYIGALHPRKNLKKLFLAFDLFKKEDKSGMQLLIVGQKSSWAPKDLLNVLNTIQCRKDIIFTGRVSNKELNDFLCSAFAMTYVSYFEGFGIPLIEAMQAGIPIICGNKSALPEIAGEAALKVNPFDPIHIAKAMTAIANNESLRKSLLEKAKEQKKKFNWEQSAHVLWDSIQKCL